MNYITPLEKRYSVKKFSDQKVPKDALERILKAGQLSASSLGLQPYKIYILESSESLEKVADAFYNKSQISTCSHLILITAKTNIEDSYIEGYFRHISEVREIPMESLEGFKTSIQGHREKVGTENLIHWSEKQGYIVLGHLIMAAALEEIDSSPMEGFNSDILAEALGIDTTLERPAVTLALGYRAQDDVFSTLKKVRKPNEKLLTYL
ncbi:NAD(P)H-dependent oxidoreductase [Chryseobacterium sp. A301]